jgi:hypothetical protein
MAEWRQTISCQLFSSTEMFFLVRDDVSLSKKADISFFGTFFRVAISLFLSLASL